MYKILNTREEVTVITEVEYTFEDGSTSIVNVSHFMPKQEDDIIKGIENRFITEQANKNIIEE